jgi:hypothetical protein
VVYIFYIYLLYISELYNSIFFFFSVFLFHCNHALQQSVHLGKRRLKHTFSQRNLQQSGPTIATHFVANLRYCNEVCQCDKVCRNRGGGLHHCVDKGRGGHLSSRTLCYQKYINKHVSILKQKVQFKEQRVSVINCLLTPV